MLRAWPADTAGADGWSAALADPVTARALAATAGLSRAGFARRFTALVGEPR